MQNKLSHNIVKNFLFLLIIFSGTQILSVPESEHQTNALINPHLQITKRSEQNSHLCHLCNNSLNKTDVSRFLGHSCKLFHKECLDSFIKEHKQCPVCLMAINLHTEPLTLESLKQIPTANEIAAGIALLINKGNAQKPIEKN